MRCTGCELTILKAGSLNLLYQQSASCLSVSKVALCMHIYAACICMVLFSPPVMAAAATGCCQLSFVLGSIGDASFCVGVWHPPSRPARLSLLAECLRCTLGVAVKLNESPCSLFTTAVASTCEISYFIDWSDAVVVAP